MDDASQLGAAFTAIATILGANPVIAAAIGTISGAFGYFFGVKHERKMALKKRIKEIENDDYIE